MRYYREEEPGLFWSAAQPSAYWYTLTRQQLGWTDLIDIRQMHCLSSLQKRLCFRRVEVRFVWTLCRQCMYMGFREMYGDN